MKLKELLPLIYDVETLYIMKGQKWVTYHDYQRQDIEPELLEKAIAQISEYGHGIVIELEEEE